MLEQAIACAVESHTGQLDKGGQPYILHALSVMFRVRNCGGSETAQAVAVLHDVIEDTPVTLLDVRKQFGPEISRLVYRLSRHDGETYRQYILRVAEDPTARMVKIEDLHDNLDPRRHAWAQEGNPELLRLKRRYEDALEVLTNI